MFTTKPETVADIEAVSKMLTELPIGAVLTYSAINDAIGRDVTNGARYVLAAAKKRTEAETGALYEAVRKVGVKRLPTDEIASVGTAAIRKVRRTARRGMKRLGNVKANDISPDQSREIVMQRSVLGAVAMLADGRKTKALANEGTTTAVIPAGRVLEIFGK